MGLIAHDDRASSSSTQPYDVSMNLKYALQLVVFQLLAVRVDHPSDAYIYLRLRTLIRLFSGYTF